MANKRYVIDGYGQVELNNCAFRRDGRIEAQCAPDTTDFSTAKVENGMLLAVDNVTRTVKFAEDASLPIALVYTAEHIYDERTPGLKNFALNGKDDFLPRLGYLSVGDKFTENCICYSTSEFANDSAVDLLNVILPSICRRPATFTVSSFLAPAFSASCKLPFITSAPPSFTFSTPPVESFIVLVAVVELLILSVPSGPTVK